MKTSSEKLTLTCVYAYAFHESGFISVYYNHEILVGVRLSESFRRDHEGRGAGRALITIIAGIYILGIQISDVTGSPTQ